MDNHDISQFVSRTVISRLQTLQNPSGFGHCLAICSQATCLGHTRDVHSIAGSCIEGWGVTVCDMWHGASGQWASASIPPPTKLLNIPTGFPCDHEGINRAPTCSQIILFMIPRGGLHQVRALLDMFSCSAFSLSVIWLHSTAISNKLQGSQSSLPGPKSHSTTDVMRIKAMHGIRLPEHREQQMPTLPGR